MNKKRIYGYALLGGAMLIAASMPIAFQLGSALPVTTLLFYISLLGTVTSFAVMLAKGSTQNLKHMLHDRTHLLSVAAIGVLIFTAEPLGLAYVTHHINADLVAVVFRTWPLFLVLLAPPVIKEKITRWDALGVVVGFTGLGATALSGTAISIPLTALPFVALVLIIALMEGLSTAISKRYNYELTSSVFVFNLISLAVFAPLAILTSSWQLTIINTSTTFAILFLGVLTEAVFTYMFYDAFRLVKTSIASTAFIMVSFLTMLLAGLFIAEPVQPYYLVIAASVILGIAVQKIAPKPAGNFIISKKGAVRPSGAVFDVTSAFIGTINQEVAKMMSGNGRVLAILLDKSSSDCISAEQITSFNGDGCVMLTNRHNAISADELEFIKEITGAKEEHTIIIGSGEPETVMSGFSRIERLAAPRSEADSQPI